jgi:hypothetical protein
MTWPLTARLPLHPEHPARQMPRDLICSCFNGRASTAHSHSQLNSPILAIRDCPFADIYHLSVEIPTRLMTSFLEPFKPREQGLALASPASFPDSEGPWYCSCQPALSALRVNHNPHHLQVQITQSRPQATLGLALHTELGLAEAKVTDDRRRVLCDT